MRAVAFCVGLTLASVAVGAQSDEPVTEIRRKTQMQSLFGLTAVDLRIEGWAGSSNKLDEGSLPAALARALVPAGVNVTLVPRDSYQTPHLLLSYHLHPPQVVAERALSVYWVKLELWQTVNWTWTIDSEQQPRGGRVVTWSGWRTGVLASPFGVPLLEREVTSLGEQLAADVKQAHLSVTPHIGRSEVLRPQRRPLPPRAAEAPPATISPP